jgi:short-subunit dehydrogenase
MHVAITGASAGLGEATAREFARRGADVTLVARRRDVLERLAAELPVRSHVVTRDLTDTASAATWIDEAEAALGPIDVLVSNAGLLTLAMVADFDPREAERMVAINLLSPMKLVQTVLPRMLARRSGTIVNVTSQAAFVAPPGWAYQGASKAGSSMFSETLRSELRGSGVNVLTVYPGLTDTEMTRSGMQAYASNPLAGLMPMGRPEEFARRLCTSVERRRARMFYPRFYGISSWIPSLSRFFAARLAALPPPPKTPA